MSPQYRYPPLKLIGLPYEGKEDFRRGASLGPAYIRWALESIESFSPYQGRELPPYQDEGDHYFPGKFGAQFVAQARAKLEELLAPGEKFILLGGDHLITLPALELLSSRDLDDPHPLSHSRSRSRSQFIVVHLDAHLDRRDSFEGERLSHATVIKRAEELLGPGRLISLGVRSKAPCEEKGPNARYLWEETDSIFEELAGSRVYLTLDLDVLDPGIFPAVSNPEPGGMGFRELLELLFRIGSQAELIGADLVEFNPLASPSAFESGALAATLLRELLILLSD